MIHKSFSVHIISLSIFTIVLISFVNWYINISSFEEYIQSDIKSIKEAYLENYKNIVKNKVNIVNQEIKYQQKIDTTKLEYTLKNKIEIQQNILKRLQFDKNQKNYIFIYDIHNINGGDNFATMILNQNRPDLVGEMINDNYKDAKGKEFRKEMLKGVRQKGETYVKYWYKKSNHKRIKQKMSYFFYNKDWNWVIGSGFYFDDLEKQIHIKEQNLDKHIETITSRTIKITILLSLIVLFITVLVALRIDLKHTD